MRNHLLNASQVKIYYSGVNEDYRQQTVPSLVPVVGLSPFVRESAVVHSAGVEPLELSVLVVAVLVLHVVLRPVDVGSFGGQSRGETRN